MSWTHITPLKVACSTIELRGLKFGAGREKSNSRLHIGNVSYFHYTIPAYWSGNRVIALWFSAWKADIILLYHSRKRPWKDLNLYPIHRRNRFYSIELQGQQNLNGSGENCTRISCLRGRFSSIELQTLKRHRRELNPQMTALKGQWLTIRLRCLWCFGWDSNSQSFAFETNLFAN